MASLPTMWDGPPRAVAVALPAGASSYPSGPDPGGYRACSAYAVAISMAGR